MKDPNWSHEDFLEHFRYDPDSGVLYRIKRTGNNWKPGPVTPSRNDRYVGFRFRGQICRVHRAAFFYMTGKWPEGEVDHIDLDPFNNRWDNLRSASRSQNGFNKGAQVRNITGHKNVFITPHGTFQVRISAFGDEITKTFKSEEEAISFARKVRSALHGEFTRHE